MSNNSNSGSSSSNGSPGNNGSSADEIIEALAQEMGGDESGDTEGTAAPVDNDATPVPAEATPIPPEATPSGPIPRQPAPAPEAPKAEARPEPAKETKGSDKKSGDNKKGGDKKGTDSKRDAAKAADAGSPEPSGAEFNNDAAISSIFAGAEESPLRPVPADAILDEEPPKSKALLWLGIIVVVGLVAVAIAYFTLSPERKECLRLVVMVGPDACEQYHETLAREAAEAERLARLAAAPKFGSLTIITEPRAFRVSAPGQASYIFPGTRTDMMIPTRTRLTFENISVSEPFTFTIHGDGNFEDLTVTIPIYSDLTSPWIQNQMTGDYTAERIYSVCWPGSPDVGSPHCINPLPARAAELYWRSNWEPPAEPPPGMETAPSRLFGQITVTSNPSDALIAFNGKQVCDPTTGEPVRTPATFQQYVACDDVAAAAAAAEAAAAAGTPPDPAADPAAAAAAAPRIREVFLAREGLPIQVLLDGKVPTGDAVLRHQFLCNPVEGAIAPAADVENPDFLGYCTYSYAVHFDLQDPPPPPAEGSGEGSGAPAEGTGAAAP